MTLPSTGNDGQPVRIIYPIFSNGTQSKVGYFNGDLKRPYLPSINSTVTDSFGRYELSSLCAPLFDVSSCNEEG